MTTSSNDLYSNISSKLKSSSIIGKKIIYFESLSSTQDQLKELSKTNEEGLIIVAGNLTQARGRFGRKFYTNTGGLYFSILLKPQLDLSESRIITLAASISLAESIYILTNLKSSVKWPNDLLLNGLKFSGILSEVYTVNDSNYLLLGIGINVNFPKNKLPSIIQSSSTTLKDVYGKNLSKIDLLSEFLKNFNKMYISLKKKNKSELLKKWVCWDDNIGKQVSFSVDSLTYYGQILGINTNGELLLNVNGDIMNFSSGELRFVE